MRTQLYCHNCNGYFNADFDETVNGNHVVKCPNCKHEHCRVIKDGIVTDDRWDSRNPTIQVVGYGWSTTSTSISYTTIYDNWSTLASDTTSAY
jgi:hypothetical protein